MTVEEHFVLDLVGKEFKPAVFRKACEVDPNIGWSYFSDQTTSNCAQAAQQWQDYVQWHQSTYGPGADVNENAELGRGDIIIYYKCKSGEIDPGSCNLYNQIKGQIADGAAQTSQTIINNIGQKCEIGVDPNCYP